jgi:hypothetical protein
MRQGCNKERVSNDEKIRANLAERFSFARYDQSVSDEVCGGDED